MSACAPPSPCGRAGTPPFAADLSVLIKQRRSAASQQHYRLLSVFVRLRPTRQRRTRERRGGGARLAAAVGELSRWPSDVEARFLLRFLHVIYGSVGIFSMFVSETTKNDPVERLNYSA